MGEFFAALPLQIIAKWCVETVKTKDSFTNTVTAVVVSVLGNDICFTAVYRGNAVYWQVYCGFQKQ